MSSVDQRLSDLSPQEKRKLLAQLLQERAKKPASFPLSFAQQRLWFLDQLAPGNPFYNIPIVAPFSGSVEILTQILNEVVRRHEALRTTFRAIEGQPVQVIAPSLKLDLPIIDLRQLPDGDRQAEANRLVEEEIQRPFDLASGPLVRAMLLQLDAFRYLFVLTMHHIISDGWSMEIFSRELSTLYQHFIQGQPSPLPDLLIQYADFAVWQRDWLKGEVLEKQLAYWKKQLADLPVLQLPTDRPRPNEQRFQGAYHKIALSPTLSAELRQLSREEGVTLFMTLVAAFKTLLYRYSGQTDIVVGVPIAGRNRLELENLIGFFVNSLVLRTDLSGNPTFRQLLSRVREAALDAYAHQDLPFEKLVDELRPQRDLSRNPLFQVTFQLIKLHQLADTTLQADDPILSSLKVRRGTAIFDIAFSLWDGPAGINGGFEYNTDLFDPDTVERMAGHFQTLLAGIVADPQTRLGQLALLPDGERKQILEIWNRTSACYPADRCLHEPFEAQVAKTPDSVAVSFEDQSVTYRELNRCANQLAHRLQGYGVGPDVLVGLFLERSIEMVVGLLAVLKAGGAYVPLDPAYPTERLSLMLGDIPAPVLLTQKHLLPILPTHAAKVILLDDHQELAADLHLENVRSAVQPDHLAYVIFTSGSTGKPKGVMISHRAICNHMEWMASTFPLTEEDAILQRTPFSFDASVWEFYAPLWAGARLVMASPQRYQDGAELVRQIQKHKITILQLVPSLLALLLDVSGVESCRSLRRVYCGGEALPPDLVTLFYERLDANLFNLYGPTETTVDATVWECREIEKHQAVLIGRPIANNQAYILDDWLQPVPIGVPGELYLGGVGLGRGYLHQGALTAERFIPHPFDSAGGTRLYKTGDLVRYRPDGNIEYLGRTDHQVKVRGFRIELGEVEALLREYEGIKDAIVVPKAESVNGQSLVAYVLWTGPLPLSVTKLRRFLSQQLPEYMVPTHFVSLDVFPLLPNGKVNRKALPDPAGLYPAQETTYAAPHTVLERKVAAVWQEALQLDKVGIYDNFFDLGGHSLLMIRLHSKLREMVNADLSLMDLFRYPTINALVQHLSQEEQATPSFDKIEERSKKHREAMQQRQRMRRKSA